KYPMEDVVQEMRNKAIKIQPVEINAPGQGRVTSAFTIQFSYPDRFKAQAVVSQLVTKFMEQNATVSRNNATITANFLGDELKQRIMDTRANLAAAQEKFTPNHPDIRSQQATLASLERQFAEAEAKDLETQAAAPSTQPQVRRFVNPLNQKMVNDLQGSINL